MAVKLNKHDLEFILDQIKIAEAHVAGTPLDQLIAQPHLPYGLRTVDGSYNNLIEGRELWGASDQVMPRMLQPHWLNENDEGSVDINGPGPGGVVDNENYGVNGSPDPDVDGPGPDTDTNGGHTGHVIDTDPRIITNLISDQTLNNPAAIMAALQHAEYGGDLMTAVAAIRAQYKAYIDAAGAAAQVAIDGLSTDPTPPTPTEKAAAAAAAIADPAIAGLKAALYETLVNTYGIEMDGNSILLPNVAPDEGLSAPFNGWMTFFGQFFDHGLDLIAKGDNGTIWMPLAPDDPLRTHGPDGIENSGDEVPPHMAFMALTRLNPETGPGADGVMGTGDDTMEARNKTTPFVDQNQTYTSHPSHQVFLREYAMVDGKPVATGRLLDGENGGLPTWADIKREALDKLGIQLDDRDIFGVPLLRTDPYGEFIRDENGFPQVITNIGPDLIPNTADDVTQSGTPDAPVVLASLNGGIGPVRTSHAFLDDIAHNAVPVLFGGGNGLPASLQADPDNFGETDSLGNPVPTQNGQNIQYDNELLDRHFITGDGRGNENIGLTAVHHVFHSEHNRQVEDVKKQILELAESGNPEDIAFLNEWLAVDVSAVPTTAAGIAALRWDGERLFQTGRFATEMQYQHLVFEEFGRKVQPLIDLFVFNTVTDVNPAIFAEFAHTVYRFGHSMLTDHLKLLPLNEAGQPVDAEGNPIDVKDWGVDVGLIEAFLNPVMFDQNGGITADQAAGAIFRGLTYVHGNEIDEFVVESLRNNLLGLPLDLAAINIARGRDAGVPSLNEAREQLYEASNSTWLKPYESWADFGANLKTPASIINFIAAYGTHGSIVSADTLEEKRDAAMKLLGLAEGTGTEAASFANASFEANSLVTGQPGVFTNPLGNYTTTAPDGWTLTGGEGGLIDPADDVVDPAGVTGTNVAWLRAGGMLAQETGQVLEAGANYRLTLDIGDRTDLGWPGGHARLVDENGNVLAFVDLPAPTNGGWSEITVETGPIGAAYAGRRLSIEIQQGDGTFNQILIDNVRLDVEPAADRLDFLNGTGAWAGVETGLNLVDLWIGGLAEKIMPFGGMLGSTFNAVFELQMENLQEGDRFYYLSRTQGLNLLNELENNAFSKLIAANTDMTDPGPDGIIGTEDDVVNFHVGVDSFAKHDTVLEVDASKQIALDPEGDDPFLESIRTKVQRDDPSTLGADANYLRFTGGEHAVMGGTANNDTIIGGDGDDAIWGDGGNDRIEGGHGVDLIVAGFGDDIITDTGDTGDFIKGEGGDDVIANSNGLDVVMSGDGKDVVFIGVDATEVFAGEGDDFILGGLDHDFILGNEGDDWMEGGDGFDVLNGDNSELFFNSTILGHDVMFAGANENDFDAESGDDIMVQGESVMRNEGMFGFDWAIHKGSPVAADSDMRIPIFTTVFDDILRDRFDQTEALSGWKFNDILRGDDRGSGEEIEVEFDMTDHELTWAGVDRIEGLEELLVGLLSEDPGTNVDREGVVAFKAGNILIGGDGHDVIEGRGADDFIHGDAWLNVRISLRELDVNGNVTGNEFNTVDSLKQEITFNGETKSLSAFLLEGTIKPKQLEIVREILYDEDATADVDTAVFAGNRDWYEITELDGGVVKVARRESEDLDPAISEGTDTLVGIERIQFADQIYTIRETGNVDPTGRLSIDGMPATEGEVLTVSAEEVRDLNNPDGKVTNITYRWQVERNDGTGDYMDIPNVSGNSFTPSDEHVGLRIRVIGTYIDGGGVIETVMSAPTDVVIGLNDQPEGPLLISDMTPTEGGELTVTVAFTDPDGMSDAFEELLLAYQWQYLSDLGWSDVLAEEGGNSRVFTPNSEHVGAALRVVVTYTDDLANEHTVTSAVTTMVGNRVASNDATITGDADGPLNSGDNFVQGGGAANAITGLDGNDVINGGGGNDILNGGAGRDTLKGEAGVDNVNGGDGDDTIILGSQDGTDTIEGGGGHDTLRIVETLNGDDDTAEIVLGNGLITSANGSSVAGIENAQLDLGNGTDTLSYASAGAVSVNLLAGTATGFSHIRGVENVTGNAGADTLVGNLAGNLLDGAGGDDTVRGGFGNDNLVGGAGNDQLWGDEDDDTVDGGAGNDRIDGGAGNDTASYANAGSAVTVTLSGFLRDGVQQPSFEEQNTGAGGLDRLISIENLTGSNDHDTLTGNDGANILDGNAGADIMSGGLGNDTYVVDDAGDQVNEGANAGSDTVRSSLASYILGGNVDNLVLEGSANINGEGNELDNRFTGNRGDNVLDGHGGTDTLVLRGGITEHTFFTDSGDFKVSSNSGGTDTLTGIEQVEFDGRSYTIVSGTNGADVEAGTADNDLVLGFNGNDTLNGNGGDDILVGGDGNDQMAGHAGDDVFVVEDDGDTVNGGGGTDTIISSIDVNLHAGLDDQVVNTTVENATLIGSDNLNARGNGLANVLTGNVGNNDIFGANGDDSILGGAGNDSLRGGNDNDKLEGGVGSDTLDGGDGSDTAVFAGSAGDYAFGLNTTGLATITNLESGHVDTLVAIERLQFGTEPALDIVTVADGIPGGPSIIFGSEAGETIIGSDGNDVIIGGAGNDTLNGSNVPEGDNATTGALDDDTFIWNAGDGTDAIHGGFEGPGGDVLQIVGNEQSETYRIYTYEEAVARIGFAGNEEAEIVVTRQAQGEAEIVIADLTEIEEIVVNGAGVGGNGSSGGDTFEIYGNFETTTSLRLNTITIVGTEGDDTVDITSLQSAHRIVFKTKGGDDTIIGTLRPQDVVLLANGKTIDDYTITPNEDGSTTIAADGHSVNFRSTGGLPDFVPGDNDDDDEGPSGDGPSDDDQNEQTDDDYHDDEPDDDHHDDDDNDDDHDGEDDDDDDHDDDEGSSDCDEDESSPTTSGAVTSGTNAADALTGTAADEVFMARGNRDVVLAGDGGDDVFGGSGADMLYGDGGNDRIFAGQGDDLITGGRDSDTVFGGEGSDVIVATRHDGSDTYYGGEVADLCGSDTLDMSAITANVTADLGTGFMGRGHVSSSLSGNDTLWGIENIVTGSGDDTITASGAANVMDAGEGEDTFRFLSASDADGDMIASFQPGDRLDLSTIDANGSTATNGTFSLVSDAFTGARGELLVSHESEDGEDFTIVSGDTTGDGNADFRITVKGSHELDFNL